MMNVTFSDEIGKKIQAKCQEVGMTKSELIREAMRLTYGISEEDTESQKEKYKIYLTKDNYDYLFRYAGKEKNAESVEEFVNKRVIPNLEPITKAICDAVDHAAKIYT